MTHQGMLICACKHAQRVSSELAGARSGLHAGALRCMRNCGQRRSRAPPPSWAGRTPAHLPFQRLRASLPISRCSEEAAPASHSQARPGSPWAQGSAYGGGEHLTMQQTGQRSKRGPSFLTHVSVRWPLHRTPRSHGGCGRWVHGHSLLVLVLVM